MDSDREIVSQVIYKRLSLNMSLGMDVTTYYGVKKALGETLTTSDLNSTNAYNTRRTDFLGLPVGPICNPSEKAIIATLNPSDSDYVSCVHTGLLNAVNIYNLNFNQNYSLNSYNFENYETGNGTSTSTIFSLQKATPFISQNGVGY